MVNRPATDFKHPYLKDLPHRQAWNMAWPMILSNISSPLMGVADTAMLGHLDSALYLGAVAIGANILAFLFWGFAFLRMGTTSFTGRALGADQPAHLQLQLGQSLVLAVVSGAALIALQWLIVPIAISLMAPNPEIAELASRYCHIRMSAAPAVLVGYVMIGLLIGLQNTRLPLVITVASNLLNIVLDYAFIVVFDWKSDGAAYASLIAELSAGALAVWMGLYALKRHFGTQLAWPSLSQLFNTQGWMALLKLNGDLFVRTSLLLFIFNFFTAQSGQLGPDILAANAILMQLVLFQSFGLDGYAHAVEAMGARALGAKDYPGFFKACAASATAALVMALMVAAVLAGIQTPLVAMFTDISEVALQVNTYYHWLIIIPLVSVWTYLFDGIFIGAGKTRIMLLTMLIAVFCGFLPLWWYSRPWGNNGLWLSFIIFNAIRGASLGRAFYTLSARDKWF